MNKQQRTYTILRDRIHAGEFPPMARLNIDALARELGVSPIPVREALRRLEAEGWVRFQPNVGALVAPLDATTWEQELVAVAILEGAATADAAARLRPADMTRLREIAVDMAAVAEAGDPARFTTLNRRLHATIVARCGNAYLADLLHQAYTRIERIRGFAFSYLPDRSALAVTEHAHLLDLLESGDPAEVERYARWHKLQMVEAYRKLALARPAITLYRVPEPRRHADARHHQAAARGWPAAGRRRRPARSPRAGRRFPRMVRHWPGRRRRRTAEGGARRPPIPARRPAGDRHGRDGGPRQSAGTVTSENYRWG